MKDKLFAEGESFKLKIWNKAHDGESVTRSEIKAFVTLALVEVYQFWMQARTNARIDGLSGIVLTSDPDVRRSWGSHNAFCQMWNVLGRPYKDYVTTKMKEIETKEKARLALALKIRKEMTNET